MKTRLSLKVVAGASRTEFAGRHGEAWKLRVAAPPVDGKANAAIIRFLAQLTGLKAADVVIVTGQTSPAKTVEFTGLDAGSLHRAILNSDGNRSDNS